jgi:N-acetylglucosamine kinase-like BadF-type ATPase
LTVHSARDRLGEGMTDFYLGVDVGGTKSHALLADQNGRVVGFGEGGAGNYEVVGWKGLRQTLQGTVDQALASASIAREHVTGAGFGVGGYDWPGEEAPTRQAIESLGLSAPYGLVNDATIGLLAGAADGWGLVVVAGTGNNCRGRDRQGREGGMTGCGPVFGEYGGASELVAEAVKRVAYAWTQRGPATRLAEAFAQLAGASSTADLLEGLYLEQYHLTAAAAPTIFQLAAEGDGVAQDLIHWCGNELGGLALGVIRQLGFEDAVFDVVLAGSLYDGSPALIEAMRGTIQAVAPGSRLVRLEVPPVVGGVLLAMEQVGSVSSGVRETLIESTNEYLRVGQDVRHPG